jgi:uncharacterized protein YcaQ
MPVLDVRAVRRLALACAGLLRADWTGLPSTSRLRGPEATRRAHSVIDRFGYLQLDTVSVTGARTQGIVLASRLDGYRAANAEELLVRGAPLFEYWGHEASWLPLALYPVFEFRRRDFAVHPWWGDLLTEHRSMADDILARVRSEGALRSLDLEGERAAGWWNLKLSKRIAEALWSSGELAIAERRSFQRFYDLPERVIPSELRDNPWPVEQSIRVLALRALDAHGWATTSTIGNTWRLRGRRDVLALALGQLHESGEIEPCLMRVGRDETRGWIQPRHLELAERLVATRVHRRRGVLLSPFDPVLWDRARVATLFGFEQKIEIYTPKEARRFGYYVLPVLAGDELVARVDLKAHRAEGVLSVVSVHCESSADRVVAEAALASGLKRFAKAVELELGDVPGWSQ